MKSKKTRQQKMVEIFEQAERTQKSTAKANRLTKEFNAWWAIVMEQRKQG